MNRRRRDLSSSPITDQAEDDKTESETSSESKSIEKRSSEEEKSVPSVDELLEGSENVEDVQRRTRQLRPSIISSPWRVSSGASYRSIDYSPSYGSNLNNFPTATAGLLYKSDGRFYPTNNFKPSGEFNPVISTYSGGSKNKFNPQQSYNSYSSESSQDASPKYKQSSKIPGHSSSSLFPLLFSLDSFQPKTKITTAEPVDSHDNYSYFHLGKTQSQSQPKPDKHKTFAFPVTNLPTTTRNPFAGFNSVGGFFNNNQGFLPLKPVGKPATPAPIYEGAKSASSYDSRYTTPSPLKASDYANNPFLNNLAFGHQSASIFNSYSHGKKKDDDKIVQITTKKPSFAQYPIPSSTPKYIQAYTTPNQLFDFDKFVAGIRESQRLQSGHKFNGFGSYAPNNQSQHVRLTSTTTTVSPDEYYYEDDDDDDEQQPPPSVDHDLSRFKTQSAKPSINSFNRKPPITSNAASNEDDFYYDDDDDDEDEEEFRPPPINKPKYTPMTETMAPRPINVTTVRPYYVSGHTFSTPSPPTSTSSIVPSIIKFPDDVFQAIRPFTSPAPNLINKFNLKPSKTYDIGKSTTTTTTTERTSTKRTKSKVSTKTASSTTAKPTRFTTRRKTYTIRPNRGNLKFKPTTKRPDLTGLEIDEKLPNR